MTTTSVSYTTQDRQWDARFNVPTDEYLQQIVTAIMLEQTAGKFKYILISGVEVGTRPYQTDYKVRHIHVAVVFHNRATKSSILKNWDIIEGNGYYLVPRNRDFPYSGWREHHIKEFSKVDKEKTIIFEAGELPHDCKPVVKSTEEKKRKVDDILIDMRNMYAEGKDEEVFLKYPRNAILYGPRLKATVHQKKNFFNQSTDPHIWLHGYSGAGKTSIMSWLYPNYYKKDLSNRFFDLYDEKEHSHVMLEDLDHETVEKLGMQFLKTICDPQGFVIDQKYKTPQPTRTVVLVTSNFSIPEIIGPDTKGVEVVKSAMLRRFWHLRVDKFYHMLGIKMIDKYERSKLKASGNQDISKIFMSWDYLQDGPTGLPLKKIEDYQTIIRNEYYKQ